MGNHVDKSEPEITEIPVEEISTVAAFVQDNPRDGTFSLDDQYTEGRQDSDERACGQGTPGWSVPGDE